MSASLPEDSKYRIYISALTPLNIDEHNRIPTTDVRLLRRMVRDNRTRGYSAENTISMWKSVRRGEDQNIFPYQEKADVMVNSALIYELPVLKIFAEPLLFQIAEDSPCYQEAKRLLKFLDYVLARNPFPKILFYGNSSAVPVCTWVNGSRRHTIPGKSASPLYLLNREWSVWKRSRWNGRYFSQCRDYSSLTLGLTSWFPDV